MRFRLSISWLLFFCFPLVTGDLYAQTPTGQIRLNQVGFYPAAPKVAVVVGSAETRFYVTTPDLQDTVYTGTLGASRTWTPSGESVKKADFSALQALGTYVVAVPDLGHSYPFTIGDYVHDPLARAAIKGFYYQRASTPLPAAYAGTWARVVGHPDNNVLVHPSAASDTRPAGSSISAPRGWYDAGDYNKYIVNSGITMGTLFMLYEHFPAYFDALGLNIPESGNDLPDLLDEVLWNLRWMLAMQDPADGGVYHKLTNAGFDGMVMPDRATTPRYVVAKSTAATLDFAAVTAMAARVFAGFETQVPGLADSCRTAAQAAWNWAVQHPNQPYNQGQINQNFHPDISTGEYGDGSFTDEFRWAAAELFITTGNDVYLQTANPLDESTLSVPGWPNVGTLAYISLAHHAATVGGSIDTGLVRSRLLALANQIVSDRGQSAYDIAFGKNSGEFYWGSNATAANQGIILIQAFRLTGEDRYLHTAISNLDYLLGRNATGYSFVTGYGDRTPMHPHHRPSEADHITAPVPGLLVGGPNRNKEDQSGCPAYPSSQPAQTYIDNVCSYASNEIAINWNAPLAYLAGSVEALLSPTGLPVGIEEAPDVPGRAPAMVWVYPDPAQTEVFVSIEMVSAGEATIHLVDLLGRTIVAATRTFSIGRYTIPIDVRNLAGGLYLVVVRAGGHSYVQKVVVMK